MSSKFKNLKYWLINAAVFLGLYLIQYNGVFSIKIVHANPILPLCVALGIAMNSGEVTAVITGLIAGIMTDAAASTPIGFNTVIFMILSLCAWLTVKYLFNNNYRSAFVIGALASFIYFIVRGFAASFSGDFNSDMIFIMQYILPSALYCAFAVLFLYLFEKKITQKFYVR